MLSGLRRLEARDLSEMALAEPGYGLPLERSPAAVGQEANRGDGIWDPGGKLVGLG